MKIALLEDDPVQAEALQRWLAEAGHDVHVFMRGRDLLQRVSGESFDAFLLDWMLPDQTGHDVLCCLRQEHGITAPIVFVTSLSTEEGVTAGLNAGADDYMIKPIRRLELLSRLEAIWRRAQPRVHHPQYIDIPPFQIDVQHRRLLRAGMPIDGLTEKEFALALLLFENLGRLLSREYLLGAVWGLNAAVPTRTLDTHISRIRKKLALGPESGFRLVPAYNYGYRLERVVPITQ
ncbi:MAG: response regulator transcription factor [Zoogloeaceae bacterium]|jgi:DNA-binding response OmpR family regulator|nr:response regulator transcription factor [Zoogloeaceae bacterium]